MYILAKCEKGATAIEYGLIAGGIALIIILAVANVGGALDTTFTNVADNLDEPVPLTGPPILPPPD
jgi:pilus assembly protein Flp/PilA